MASRERVNIYIDGGNFYHLVLKKLNIKELNFSFDEFILFLANGRTVVDHGKRYYVGTVREQEHNPRSKEAMSRQTTLFTYLRSYGWEIKTSKLRTRMERVVIDERVVGYQDLLRKGVKEVVFARTREKGIDVKMATDMIAGALDDRYDTAVVVSSDADLVPALDWVRLRRQKRIEYVGFSILDQSPRQEHTRPLQTMIAHSDIQRILVASDLEPFRKPFAQKLL